MYKVTLPFGTISFIDFPLKARKFSDFPDGRLVVGPRATGHVLFYQINIMNGLRGSFEANKCEQVTLGLVRQYLQEQFADPAIEIYGLEDLITHLKYCIDPPALKGRPGTTQLLRGVSTADRSIGTVVLDLVFARVIRFRMVGWKEGMTTRPARPGYYSGTVMFAKRKYAFSLNPHSRWEWNTRPMNVPIYSEEVRAGIILFSKHMSEHDAEAQMRYWIERWFPFVKDYDMLGAFVFDAPLTSEEILENNKGVQGKTDKY